MISLLAMFTLPSPDFRQEFRWSKVAEVRVTGEADANYICALALGNGATRSWHTELSATDGPLNETPECHVRMLAGDARLIALQLQVPNWNKTIVWVAGGTKTSPLVFKFRDSPEAVLAYRGSHGHVTTLTFFDRWVGGKPKVLLAGGRRLDRWEEVTAYKVGPAGFAKTSVYRRLVPNDGGGASETLFRRVHRH